MKKIQEFFKNIRNLPRMYFGHRRTITTFKNRNFLKIWVFEGFPYTKLGHCELIFRQKKFKILAENSQRVVKNGKKIETFQKCSKLPQNAFWTSQNHPHLQKPKFPQILGFSGFAIPQIKPFWAHFWPKNFKILAENGQGVMKK